MVSFANINPGYKLPGVSVEVDPSQAGTPVNPKWLSLHAIKTAAGVAPANQQIAVGTQADADRLMGPGSMGARMFKAAFVLNRGTPIYFLPVLDLPPAVLGELFRRTNDVLDELEEDDPD